MSVKEEINRGINLVGVSLVALSGFALFPEFFIQDGWLHKLGEAVLFILSLTAVGWYLKGENMYSRSVLPAIFVIISLLLKLFAVIFL